MVDSVAPDDIDVVLTDAAWAIRSTYHTVLKASPGAAIFGRGMLFNIPFIAVPRNVPLDVLSPHGPVYTCLRHP
jgi:hypothetical protein